MERREPEWYVASVSTQEATIKIRDGGMFVDWVGQVKRDFAEQIVTEHNRHAQLVEQRDRLLRLLRPVTSPTACYCKVMKNEKCWHCEARELIAAVEQGEGTPG